MQNILNIMDLYDLNSNSLLKSRGTGLLHNKKYPFSYYQKTKENGLDLNFSLPGYGEENVTCSVSNNTLKIELAEIQDNFVDCKGVYSFQLPEDIDPSSLEASIKNGVLKISAKNAKQKEKIIKINKQ